MNIDQRIKFRHLQCFLEVARQRSFARAADLVAVSQPAISKTIGELEELLGARLFERSKAGVTLTPAGDTFLRYAGPCVQALRDGVNTLRADGSGGGLLRVGALSTVESLLLPEAVLRLQRAHPTVSVSVETGSSAHLLAQLKVGELDMVVGRMTDSPEIHGLAFEHLYSEAMTLVVRPGHPLLQGDLRDLRRLADYPLVLPLAGTTIRKYADAFFVQWGIPLTAQRLETLSLVLSRRYVEGSEAIWVAPRDAVRLYIGNGELAELALGIQEPGGSVGICTNVALPPPVAGQWFSAVLREVADEYVDT